jgi:hypothetical protein
MISLILAMGLIVSACTTKSQQDRQSQKQDSQSAQPAAATQRTQPSSDQAATATPPALPQNSTSQTATPPPKSEWAETQHFSPHQSDVKPPETSWNNVARAPRLQPVVIPAGTHITIRLDQSIDTKKNKAGDSFKGSVIRPVVVDGKTAIPESSPVTGTVVESVSAGKLKGEGRLAIRLTHIQVRGVSYPISTGTVANTLHGKGKRSAVMIGGGSGAGALVGGLVGGGKGAAVGAVVGGGAGAAGATLTGNQQLAFTAESALTFKFSRPLPLTEDSGRPKPETSAPSTKQQ